MKNFFIAIIQIAKFCWVLCPIFSLTLSKVCKRLVQLRLKDEHEGQG